MNATSYNAVSSEVLYLGGDYGWIDPDQAIDGGSGAYYFGLLDDEQSMRGLCYSRFSALGIAFKPTDVILGINLVLDYTNDTGPRLLRLFAQPTFDAGASLSGSSYTNNGFTYEDGTGPKFLHPGAFGSLWGLSPATIKNQLQTNITNFGFVVQPTQIDGQSVSFIYNVGAILVVYYSSGGSVQRKYLKSLSSILTPT